MEAIGSETTLNVQYHALRTALNELLFNLAFTAITTTAQPITASPTRNPIQSSFISPTTLSLRQKQLHQQHQHYLSLVSVPTAATPSNALNTQACPNRDDSLSSTQF